MKDLGSTPSQDISMAGYATQHWMVDQRAHHGCDARDRCYLCDQAPETIDHIIASCPFTRELWCFILQAPGFQLPQGTQSTLSCWRKLRKLSDGQRRKGLDSLFALVSWHVWKERNARCFWDATSTVAEMLQIIKMEADHWVEARVARMRALAVR